MNDDKTSWEDFTDQIEDKTHSRKFQETLPSIRATMSPSNNAYAKDMGMEDLLERIDSQSANSFEHRLPPLHHGSVDNIDRQTATRFLKGKMPIDATLDLHGYTQEAALEKLQIFIGHAYHKNYRNVLIITGKGLKSQEDGLKVDGILKERVPHWLNHTAMRSLILAFTYAQPTDGGSGALYVLLKRNRHS